MRVPAIRVLLDVFIGQHRLKRAAMQVEVKHIRGSKHRGGKRAHNQFVNGAVSLNADGGRRAGDTMGRDDQTHLGSGRRQGNGWAIVACSRHATFRMGAHPIWSASKRLLDAFQLRASWEARLLAITPRPAVSTSMRGAASPYKPSRRRSTAVGGSPSLAA